MARLNSKKTWEDFEYDMWAEIKKDSDLEYDEGDFEDPDLARLYLHAKSAVRALETYVEAKAEEGERSEDND